MIINPIQNNPEHPVFCNTFRQDFDLNEYSVVFQVLRQVQSSHKLHFTKYETQKDLNTKDLSKKRKPQKGVITCLYLAGEMYSRAKSAAFRVSSMCLMMIESF